MFPTVLRAVDFKAKAVRAGGDITALMSFHFPRGGQDDLLRGSTVIPGFHPELADRHDTRHQELLQFFHHKNKFRGQSTNPVVHFSFKFDVVNDARPGSFARVCACVSVRMCLCVCARASVQCVLGGEHTVER